MLEEAVVAVSNQKQIAEEIRANPVSKFVRQVFLDVLGRYPTESQLEDWVTQLATGAKSTTMISCLLHSQEFRERQIFEQYRKFLGRTPSKEGIKFWSGLLSSGKTQDDVLAAILASSEYFQRRGGTNEGFVRALFLDVIQRRPDFMEADSWIGLLNSGSATKNDVAQDFATSEEFRRILVQSWYWKLLHRYPDPQTLNDTLAQLKEGITHEQALMKILSCREYYVRSLSQR